MTSVVSSHTKIIGSKCLDENDIGILYVEKVFRGLCDMTKAKITESVHSCQECAKLQRGLNTNCDKEKYEHSKKNVALYTLLELLCCLIAITRWQHAL